MQPFLRGGQRLDAEAEYIHDELQEHAEYIDEYEDLEADSSCDLTGQGYAQHLRGQRPKRPRRGRRYRRTLAAGHAHSHQPALRLNAASTRDRSTGGQALGQPGRAPSRFGVTGRLSSLSQDQHMPSHKALDSPRHARQRDFSEAHIERTQGVPDGSRPAQSGALQPRSPQRHGYVKDHDVDMHRHSHPVGSRPSQVRASAASAPSLRQSPTQHARHHQATPAPGQTRQHRPSASRQSGYPS